MSALLHLGEAQHRILNGAAEIGAHIVDAADVLGDDEAALNNALLRARDQLTEARAVIGAVQLVLRSCVLAELLDYHADMAARLREGARLQNALPGRGLNAQADRHAAFAAALRTLIGTGSETTTDDTDVTDKKGGAPCFVV